MIMTSNVVVVIPTFKPPSAVRHLIEEMTLIGPVIVCDDASPCTYDPLLRLISSRTVRVLRHQENQGIARSLNEGLAAAHDLGADWLLTLDQDSWITQEQVQHLTASAVSMARESGGRVGVVGAGSIELQGGVSLYPPSVDPVRNVPEVIQSGSLWNVAALERIGGFDESLRMDAVDAEACLHLRENGFTVAVNSAVHMRHSLGQMKPIRFAGKRILVTNHDPARLESIRKSRLAIARREIRESPANGIRTIRRVLVNEVLVRLGRRVTAFHDWRASKSLRNPDFGSLPDLSPRDNRGA